MLLAAIFPTTALTTTTTTIATTTKPNPVHQAAFNHAGVDNRVIAWP